jgi:PST family polysaccharide transporter
MLLNSFSKFLFIVSVFIFVEDRSDLGLLLFLGAISTFLTGIIALFMAIKNFNIVLSWQPWERLEFYLKDGWYIFTSKIAVEFYSTVNIIILGFFATPIIVGYYAIAVKIIHAMGSLLDPLTRTVYPYLVNVYHSSSENFIKRNRQLSLVIFIIMLPNSVLVMYYSEWILTIITGEVVVTLNREVLEVFSLVLVVYLYGSQFTNILVTIKETKFLNKVLFMAAGINTILAPLAIYFYGVIGLVWLNVFVAFFVTFTKGHHIFIRLKV